MKIAIQIVLVAAVVAAGIWLWTFLHPSPQQVIRSRLNEMARDASFDTHQGMLAAFASARTVGDFFSTNVEVTLNLPGNQDWTLNGRDEVVQKIMAAHAMVSELKLDFPDLNVTVAPDQNTATADLTIRAQVDEDKDSTAEEMKLTFEKINGQWLITHIETVQVLT
jgi:ketosteroid isomerase-like protein